jgi:hypothetical protein
MRVNTVGKWLNRDIWITANEKNDSLNADIVRQSAILFVNRIPDFKSNQFEAFFKKVAECYPIIFCVSGENSDSQFDLILNVFGLAKKDQHTMTYHFKEKNMEALLGKFLVTVATESERWDEWKYYGIIINDIESQEIESLITKIIASKWNE